MVTLVVSVVRPFLDLYPCATLWRMQVFKTSAAGSSQGDFVFLRRIYAQTSLQIEHTISNPQGQAIYILRRYCPPTSNNALVI